MSAELPIGLYEQVITEGLDALLKTAENLNSLRSDLDPEEAHLLLSQHVNMLVRVALQAYPSAERLQRQIDLSNRILALLMSEIPGAFSREDFVTREILHAIFPQSLTGLQDNSESMRPGIPLSQSELLVNARGEHRIGHELDKEIRSADRIDLLCSFIKWSGLRLLQGALDPFLKEGKPLRVITTVYMGATDRRALDKLVELGAMVKVSYDTRRTRLHAKAWLFNRNTGFSTAYIGSSNLSAAAQVDGLEWNVRVSAMDAPRILHKFEATFGTYWEDPEFVEYKST